MISACYDLMSHHLPFEKGCHMIKVWGETPIVDVLWLVITIQGKQSRFYSLECLE